MYLSPFWRPDENTAAIGKVVVLEQSTDNH